jgi:hypothetical protein
LSGLWWTDATIAAITDPSVASRVLECLALPPRAPPLAPANAIDLEPAMDALAFERTLAEAQEDPGFDFDPSPVEDQDSSQGS